MSIEKWQPNTFFKQSMIYNLFEVFLLLDFSFGNNKIIAHETFIGIS